MANNLNMLKRLYGALLFAYPTEFREHYGTEMTQLFSDSCQDIYESQGQLAVWGLLPRTFLELITSAAAEHVEILGRDLAYGWSVLSKNPGFTATILSVLALGIGANTAIFSVVNAVLLRPLPFSQSENLVAVKGISENQISDISYPNFVDVQSQNRVFEQMGVYQRSDLVLTGVGDPVRLSVTTASADLLAVLGVKPQIGRSFRPEENRNGNRAVLLSQSLWQSRFAGRTSIVGEQILLSGKPYTVVGVMGSEFQFPVGGDKVDAWVSLASDAEPTSYGTITESRGYPAYDAIARLKPNTSLQQAQLQMDSLVRGLREQYPDYNARFTIKLLPQLEYLVGDVQQTLLILAGAVLCVLLIACANVASLLLARSLAREKEVAIRLALGASRGRIIRQLLTESLMLSLSGGALGLLIAWFGIKALVALGPKLPRSVAIDLDSSVLLFTVFISILTGIVFGLLPALNASNLDLLKFLKQGTRSSDSLQRLRLRGFLLVAEIALSFVLLVSSGLLVQSFLRLQQVNPGFDPHNVLSLRIDLPGAKYPNRPQVAQFYEQLLERTRQLPGVRSAAAIQVLPLSGDNSGTSLEIEGQPVPKQQQRNTQFREISLEYFKTMRINLQKGRDFNNRDTVQSPAVVIVNTAFVRKFFPNTDPLGKRISLGYGGQGPKQIVGVVNAITHTTLSETPEPEVYVPQAQFSNQSMVLILRTELEPLALLGAVQRQVHSLDSELPIYEVKTLDQTLAASLNQPKFNTLLLTVFAGIALILTATGLYGVIAYSVTQRTQELGIRLALGAQPSDILKLVVGQGLLLATAGILLGLGLAFAFTQVLANLLFGISTTDPLTFTLVGALLLIVALLASYLPARRAIRVDPIVALRCD
jgi:putative ABC transport system permease protein